MTRNNCHRITTDRRAFLKATVATAAAVAAPEARASHRYPDDYEVGEHCNLVLWLTHYKNDSEAVEAWTLSEIYTRPLIHVDVATPGLLDSLVDDRLEDAYRRGYITDSKKKNVKDAIAVFQTAPTSPEPDQRYLSMADLILANISHKPYPATKLETMLKVLHENGVYLPSSYVSEYTDDYDHLRSLLFPTNDPPLFRHRMPSGKKLGDMKFIDLFETKLRDVYKYERVTFEALQLAKAVGIFKPLRRPGDSPKSIGLAESADGVTIKVNNNGKCCDVAGTGQCGTTANKYCAPVPGGSQCNAMSEACP